MAVQLRIKIFLIAAAVLCTTLAATVWVSGVTFSREYSTALASYTFVVGRSLRLQLDRLIALHIPLADIAGFDAQCRESVDGHPGISFARVVDLDGRILFSSDLADHDQVIRDTRMLADIRSAMEISHFNLPGHAGYYCILVPVLDENKRAIAAVNIGFPMELIAGKIRKMALYSLVTALVFFGIGSILLLVSMNVWVNRPLKNLLAVIRDILHSGTETIRLVETGANDEIGQIGAAFNQMIQEVNKSHREIREHAADLEARVRVRTEELARANDQLKLDLAQRLRLEAAVEQTGEAVAIIDPQGRLVYGNPAFVRMTGHTDRQGAALSFKMLFDSEKTFSGILEKAGKGEVWCGQTPIRQRAGTQIVADITVSPIRDASSAVIDYVAVARDVTREVQIEKQLQQAQKMESIGTLAGGIAHDFNNLLSVIIGSTELALLDLDKTAPVARFLEEINAAAMRGSRLTRQILAFSRKQIISPQVVNLNDLLAEVPKMLGRLIGEHIQLGTRLDPGLRRVKVDPGQLEQVLFNLAVNARDAMPHGGKLTITTANVEVDEVSRQKHVEIAPGPYVMMMVSDTGTGMDIETQSHIFEPFFTTKEVGRGTGLGLATVYGIIKQSRGYIDVYSEPGRGAAFKIYLPCHDGDAVGPLKQAHAAAESLGGAETILVVEDDPILARLTCRILAAKGYRVLEAQNAEHALEVGRRHVGPIHLILSDVIMPGLDVREMARQFLAFRAEARILYSSGYTDDTIASYGVLEKGIDFISKPFTALDILSKVRQVLDGRQKSALHARSAVSLSGL